VGGATTAEQASDALARLTAAGWDASPGQTPGVLHASHYATSATPGVVTTYANAYGRFSVTDRLCDQSFAATAPAGGANVGQPVAAPAASVASSFGTGNGVPPTAGINIVNDASVGGPLLDAISVSPGTGRQDYNVDAARCYRSLWTDQASQGAQRVRQGVSEVLRTANLRGKPAIIVHGRDDTLIPPAFNSRPYVALNRKVEGAGSRLSYVEVTNAQHFDAFLGLAGYDTRFVPLHLYFNRAMDAMWAHLRQGAALPPSQVVRTTPRGGTGGAAPALAASNVPPIAASPAPADRIGFEGAVLVVPD
jgi:hydroxybutyrate-dimer hydrolase